MAVRDNRIVRKMGKKGFFFTVTAILFIIIIIFFATMKGSYERTRKAVVVGDRVETMNNFMIDFEKDVKRGMEISAHRSVLALLENIQVSNGTYIDDFEKRMNESMIKGSVNGTNSSLMEDSRISDWMSAVSAQGRKLNIDITFNSYSLSFVQRDPWHLIIIMNVSAVFDDSSGIARWNIDDSYETDLDIAGFEDPIFTKNSEGRAALLRIINISLYDGNFTYFNGSQWNTTNLYKHMEDGLYVHDPDAPSFIMRFEGNLSNSSCCGIESLVDVQKRYEQGLVIYQRSIVDHVYFKGQVTTNYNVNWTPSWFRIDSGHLDRYNVSEDVRYQP